MIAHPAYFIKKGPYYPREASVSDLSAPCRDGNHLTAREHEILQLLAQGFTNVQIAEHCWISRHTVNIHVCSILTKLGAANRTRAVSLAHRHGLILAQ